MSATSWPRTGFPGPALPLLGLLAALIIACGTSAPAPDGGGETGAALAPTSAPIETPSALARPKALTIPETAVPTPTPIPADVVSARDSVIFLTSEEPTTIGAASANCGGNIQNTICDDMVSDPLTWIDDQQGFEVVGLTGIEGWEQVDPNRWRFHLRDGVTFHNGAPWNAEQAKFWIDYFGDEETSGHFNSNDFSFHGIISGEVVDDLTLDVICGGPCPILPRTTIFTKFQDVGWFESASEDDIERHTVGLGPYQIVEWTPGVQVELEAYEGYQPNPSTVFAKAPAIQHVVQQWRNEPLVRASMLQAGEADWAEISLDDRDLVPKWKSATNNEVFRFTFDTLYDPELSKIEVREAMNLAYDCVGILAQLYDGLVECYGNIAQPGTVGITEANSAPHGYDLERARQLLQEANFDFDHQIVLTMRSNRVPKDVEVGEAMVSSWREVGIDAQLSIVESSVYNDVYRSSCGYTRTKEDFANAAGATLEEKCLAMGPSGPRFVSSQVVGGPTSTESLDYSRQGALRNSCFSRSSGYCNQEFEAQMEEADATPTGDLRRQRQEAVATFVHDNFNFVDGFQVVSIYGLSANLEWEPTYAPRIRANTMFFTR